MAAEAPGSSEVTTAGRSRLTSSSRAAISAAWALSATPVAVRAALRELQVGIAEHLRHPVAIGVERRAQAPRRLLARQHHVEVRAAGAAA